MFVYTLKASGLKFFLAVLLSVAVLITIVTLVPEIEQPGEVAAVVTNYNSIATDEARVNFLKQFGYEVKAEAVESKEVRIPEDFTGVYEQYNDIQRAQGLNLKKYAGKTAMRYTYEITNYGYDGTVLATLIIYKDKVIAGDVCGVTGEGFIHGFEKPLK